MNSGIFPGVPMMWRANDVVRHVINIDSRFRDTPSVVNALTAASSSGACVTNTEGDFYFTLLTTVRNVLRLRIVSVEFPNNYFFFTERRRNVTLRFLYDCSGESLTTDIVVPSGNYVAGGTGGDSMVEQLNDLLSESAIPFDITAEFSEVNGSFRFTAERPFTIDTTAGGRERLYDYGLGYYLGFTRGLHASQVESVAPPTHAVVSDTCANFSGDNYVFLRINDFGSVRQTVREYDLSGRPVAVNEFTATMKLILREPKNYMVFDDPASQYTKEVVFPAPIDLSRLRIQAVDMYGEIMDLCSQHLTLTLEVLEVRNSTMYNTMRDSLAVQYR
jgi:hypothetical protein